MANGVYWLGADNNYYVKDDAINGGAVFKANTNDNQNLVDLMNGMTRIDDPNPPQQTSTPTSSPAPSGGSAGPVLPALNQGAVDNTQLTIDQLPGVLRAALESEGTRYNNTVNGYNAQEGTQRKTYEGSTVTNQQNYDGNFMDSIRAGIKGLGGLMQLLRGTGAAGGTVDDQVRDTVGGVTSNDIRMGADTQKENQGALDSSLSTFLTDLGIKRRVADDTKINNERAILRDGDTQLQDLYGKMAGYYGDAGNTQKANDWLGLAGGLTPGIAANSRTQVSAYDQTPVAVQAPVLTAFAGPTQPNVLAAPSDGQVGSGIFTMSDRRKKEQTPALAPAGA